MGAFLDSTGMLKFEVHVEKVESLVKTRQSVIIANDNNYALAA
ncbi:Hypothetical protein F387_01177 [Wohlfahrtiimonas chitiniclastica SH04]|uniref:Uncharacterized protein n=1 Tax=Wohlfahrtiimonas chitiniclastica SH04 TaxID=1261130 RepID=L8Y0I7_9GAMM|nr:Hypothetical protein F387_01177 [Wohlfahrtiimonas chitiniclastica SH04]